MRKEIRQEWIKYASGVVSFTGLMALFLVGLPCSLSAQEERVDEEAIKIQENFIDASREKLLGNYDEAIKLLEGILRKDRENATAAFELARIYEAKSDSEKSLRYAKDATEWDRSNLWYFKFLADLQQQAGQYKAAAETYGHVVELEPYDEQSYLRQAFFLVKANEIKAALKVYDELEDRVGITEEIIRRKHTLYLGQREDRKAAEELMRLIEAYPNHVEYWHLLAGFYEQIGEDKKAQAVYKDILSIDPDNGKARMALAGQSGQESDEIRYINALKAPFADPDTDLDAKIGKLIPFVQKVAETGDESLADALLELTDILKEAHPNSAKAYAVSGDLLYHSGRKTEALDSYRKTIALDNANFMVWEQVLQIYAETYQFKALRDFSEQAMDYYPNQPIVYYMSGLADYHLNNADAATSTLQQASFMAGGNTRALILIQSLQGLLYQQAGDNAEADATFGKALATDNMAPPALARYAYALAQRPERLKDAEQMARKANELLPGQAEYQMQLGWVLYQRGDYQEARAWLQRALSNGASESPVVLEYLGDTLYQLGKTEEAVDHWKKAKAAGAGSSALQQKIEQRKMVE
ncbi:MAG: tetratricopeptide repeat protein [Phaeodactylibacter sp.]|uniref:tetratricopeptide repeat protein n=1 Tax=Phaeodactylibacter sp. TaxID=1940289 RepID=UPI0032EF86E4